MSCVTGAWNYLRVRGEYGSAKMQSLGATELPPRARRILCQGCRTFLGFGTTSACAENTGRVYRSHLPIRNYLRVRGEYAAFSLSRIWRLELPPRARRIPASWVSPAHSPGTTSACAENTPQPTPAREKAWNYLRVRGEYNSGPDRLFLNKELPPRARRILAQSR